MKNLEQEMIAAKQYIESQNKKAEIVVSLRTGSTLAWTHQINDHGKGLAYIGNSVRDVLNKWKIANNL